MVGCRFPKALTRVTEQGQRWLVSLLVVLLFGVWLRDLLLVALAVLGFVYIGITYRSMVNREAESIKVTPNVLSMTMVAGRETSEVITIESPAEYGVGLGLKGLHSEPTRLAKGTNTVELVYVPVLGGVKKLHEITLEASDRYGLFTSTAKLGVDFTFTAYPRVYPVAAQAISALAEMGTGTEGETPIYLRGYGTEYAETREYAPGDPLKRFDWKAYARTNKPMVKDYYLEGGGGTSITYDNHADNPISLDELNSTFLQLVLSLTQSMTQTQITLLREDESYELDTFNTLLLATQIALRGQVTEFMRYYTLLDPLAHRRSFTNRALRQKIQPTNKETQYESKIILSSLSGNPAKLLENLEPMNPEDTTLLVPTKPWKYQDTLEKSSHSYTEHLKMIERLEKKGYKIYNTQRDLVKYTQITYFNR